MPQSLFGKELNLIVTPVQVKAAGTGARANLVAAGVSGWPLAKAGLTTKKHARRVSNARATHALPAMRTALSFRTACAAALSANERRVVGRVHTEPGKNIDRRVRMATEG
jgi:hypothetical protein